MTELNISESLFFIVAMLTNFATVSASDILETGGALKIN